MYRFVFDIVLFYLAWTWFRYGRFFDLPARGFRYNYFVTIGYQATYFSILLKAIAEYQKGIIETNFIGRSDLNAIREERRQTFLSYAYVDKGLSQALFYYFWVRSGFLYVNWMWDGVNSDSAITKGKLENALAESDQLLFLRTANSELRIKGSNNSIRQWCAWEIGNFYTKHKNEKYYTSFYDKSLPRNDILDTFKPMQTVDKGRIR